MSNRWSTVPDNTSVYELVPWYLNYVECDTQGNYTYPYGYTQYYIKTGTWSPECNILRWWVKLNAKLVTSVAAGTVSGDELDWGNYIRAHDGQGRASHSRGRTTTTSS